LTVVETAITAPSVGSARVRAFTEAVATPNPSPVANDAPRRSFCCRNESQAVATMRGNPLTTRKNRNASSGIVIRM
jgi:hypothetical protein